MHHFFYLTHCEKLNNNTSTLFPFLELQLNRTLHYCTSQSAIALPLGKPSNLSVPLSTINCLHTIRLVGMETKHGWGGGDHRCSCLDSRALVCVYAYAAVFLSVSQDEFHHWCGSLPQGPFIYFRRPDTFT